MPFNETLAGKIRDQLGKKRAVTEKKMFGGLCFLLKGNMCCGVEKDNLVVRVGHDQYERALKQKHARPMDFTGRPLKGFVYVKKEGYKSKARLKKWIDMAIKFVRTLPAK